ncbi:1-acyl-sn-glycerol-3-phosphate acyltransferase [Haloechinothrix sp. LS1_15]|uniref:lysophospholipid acyltransferase family protein n=1 Tax=Haloechinothrix sp. LS1_15 TaxID=2652248 RepID=UPI0029442460|nr:1-acyl-sn-glycerol-3-phosphate acyltransferase [Haloechinothrix sp. LS1_15]MDV6012625.1 hypothetical protein [Haloechinothrix sp. LS1_15]
MASRDHLGDAPRSDPDAEPHPPIPEQASVSRLPAHERPSRPDPDGQETGHRAEVHDRQPRGGGEVVAFPSAAGSGAQARPRAAGESDEPGEPAEEQPRTLPEAVTSALNFLVDRLTGEYSVDEFGFDAELTEQLVAPALRVLYRKWFRVDVHGAGNLPESGGALIVANHSGTVPFDAAMTALAVHDEHPRERFLRILGADLVFQLPVLGSLARKTGQTLACNADAERLLGAGELVGVFPEGFKGIGKPFSARYKLQRFGRGGFASAAIRTGVPIIPCAIVGAEEIYPKLGDITPLARLLGLPYFPVTPFFPLLGPLGAIPLPTKWSIAFGEPITTDDFTAGDDPMDAFVLTDQVREAIQQMLYQRLAQRRGVFG